MNGNVSELTDIVSLMCFSPDDNMMLLYQVGPHFWIPSVDCATGQSWDKLITQRVTEIFGDLEVHQILRLCRIWAPTHPLGYIHHCIFQLRVEMELKKKTKFASGNYRGKLRWVTESDLKKLQENNVLKSPELVDLFLACKGYKLGKEYIVSDAICRRGNFLEMNEDVIVQTKHNLYEVVIDLADIDRNTQEVLYRQFLLHCYPAIFMNMGTFTKFICDFGWPKDEGPALFRTADIYSRYGLSFRDLLYFLTAMDPNTTHGGSCAELRCRYIFKYYDSDNDNKLKFEDMKKMILALRKSKKISQESSMINKEVEELYKVMHFDRDYCFTVMDFLRAVGELKIRGTSQIFRAPVALQQYIRETTEKELRTQKRSSFQRMGPGDIAEGKNGGDMEKNVNYELAIHTVRIQQEGQSINIDPLNQIQNAVSLTTLRQPINDKAKRQSIDLFSQKSVSNEVIKTVRALYQMNKKFLVGRGVKVGYSWGTIDSGLFSKQLITICNQAKDIFKEEPRLLHVPSPVYIMGDLHGNITDLLNFEQVLWHIGPALCPCNLLFLGDFVDRGAFSVEVISYLLSYKLQSPRKVNLIRGNHEIREIQKMFTFHGECITKFGEKIGNEVWNAINTAFDYMPIAAVVDGKLFCCHGGVPPPWLCPVISAIEDIPCPLSQPDSQSSLAWEIMWNDPVKTNELTEKLAMELLANEGFAVNIRRGTAHVFSVEALEKFLKCNNLTHLIRAHEVVHAGFYVLQKGKLVSIFSSSKYCGGNNDSACILADLGKLRILRLGN